MGVIIFTANPLTPPKKCKLEMNVLIFGQILTILGLILVTRVERKCSGTPFQEPFSDKEPYREPDFRNALLIRNPFPD